MTITYVGKRDAIAHRLRIEILQGELRVGDRLRQNAIARRYGVSPTPVREALRVLETQGFVTYAPHRGVTVADFAGSFEQVYRLREALECLATELAVRNMTPQRATELTAIVDRIEAADATDIDERHAAHIEFHRLLYAGCDFPGLLDLIEIVWSRFPWDELLAMPVGLSLRADHRPVVERAAAGDATGAAAALRDHFRAVRDRIGASLKVPADGMPDTATPANAPVHSAT
jgi:DNA-binding GntR family transcriptional regulator